MLTQSLWILNLNWFISFCTHTQHTLLGLLLKTFCSAVVNNFGRTVVFRKVSVTNCEGRKVNILPLQRNGRVVIGEDLCPEGDGFVSQHRIQDGHFSHVFVIKF